MTAFPACVGKIINDKSLSFVLIFRAVSLKNKSSF